MTGAAGLHTSFPRRDGSLRRVAPRNDGESLFSRGRTMSAALRLSSTTRSGPLHLAVVAGLACAFLIGIAGHDGRQYLPSSSRSARPARNPAPRRTSSSRSPRMRTERAGQARHHRPRVLWSRQIHPRIGAGSVTACILKGEIRSQLAGGPVGTIQGQTVVLPSARRNRTWFRQMRATPSLPD